MQASASHSDARLIGLAQTFAAVAAGLTSLLGALVLIGWALNLSLLKTPLPGQASMKPLTALGFVLAGAALWWLRDPSRAEPGETNWRGRLGRICAGLVAAMGGLLTLEYLLGVDLGIDQVLFRQAVLAENALPIGRPAPATALCLLLLGLALLTVDFKRSWLSATAALLAVFVGGLAILGYAYEVTTLYQTGPYVPIAPHTALAIILLGLGLLAARPEGPILGALTTHLSGSVLGRRLLPAAIGLPFVLGLARLYGQRFGLYDTGFGVALLVTSNVVVFAALVYTSARLLNRSDAKREAAYDALRLTEENMRLMLDSIQDHAIFMLDAQGRVASWNAGAERIKGYTAAEIIGQPVSLFYLPEEAAAGRPQRVLQAAAANGSAEEEGLRVRKDGSQFWAIADTAALRDAQGVLRGYAKVTRDITERRQAETALREREERLRVLADATPNGLIIVADSGEITWANQRAEALFGFGHDQLLGRSIDELVPGRFHAGHAAHRADFAADRRARLMGAGRDLFAQRQDGSEFPVEIGLSPVETSHGKLTLASIIDITERKQAEEALRKLNAELESRVQQRTADLAASEVKFRTMFDVLPVGVSILGEHGQVVEANAAFAEILQTPMEDLAAGAYERRDFIHPDETLVHPDELPSARAVREQRPISRMEMSTRTAAGDTIWIDASAAPLPVAGLSAVVVITDMTERKRIEADLRQSNERFAKAFHSSPVALTITRSADGLFIDVNEGFLSLFGYRREEVIGRRAAELNIVTDPVERAAMGQQFSERGSNHNYETARRAKSGESRNVLLSADALELNGDAHILTTMLDITARKSAEAALRESEARFRALFEVLPVGVSILDRQRRIVQSNPALARIMRLSDAGLAAGAYSARQIIRPDGSPMPLDEYASIRALEEQRPVLDVETGMKLETGEVIWMAASAAPLPVAGLGVVAVSVDISERKRAEAALRESEEKFSKSFHASGAGIIISRAADGRIIDANESYLRLVGYERDEIIGRTTLEIGAITPAVREQLVGTLRSQGRVRDMEIGVVTKAGEARVVVTSTESIVIGQEACMLSILYDITERKRIEQELASERDQLQALMDNVPDTIYFKDRASRFTRINLAQARLLGVAAPDMAVGKTDADFQAASLSTEFYAEEQRLLETGQALVDRLEYNPTPSGQPRWLSSTKVPLKDASGEVVGLVGISRDVTRRVAAEEDLQRLNQQLADRVNELSLVNKLEEQLQSCQSVEDTFPLTAQFMTKLAPRHAGALYLVAADRTQVTTAARWGVPAPELQSFALDDCWAIRFGQLHLVDKARLGLPCQHWPAVVFPASMCMPLLVQGQVLGVLHLRAPGATDAQNFDESTQRLTQVVADSLALTWSNLTLRESLRQQAIRDPLTGLFNRRFMEESLARELSRAERIGQSLGVIMFDIDRFKGVNDRLGHEAGDAVLRGIGQLLRASSRGSDIPCRYGGEEFLLILPEANLAIASQRAEQIRRAFGDLEFVVDGGTLAHLTVSSGVAAYPQHGDVLEAVLRAADAALYQAKRGGRDRMVVAPA